MISSKNNSKSLWPILAIFLSLIFLAALQISFFNPSFFGLNILLILLLILVIAKYDKSAIFFGWISGLLIDTVHFSNFGVSSLAFLLTAFILIIIYKTAFFSLKMENIIFMAFLSVFLYRFTYWIVSNSIALLNLGNFENFGFYFINLNFPIELITTTILTIIILKSFRTFFNNE